MGFELKQAVSLTQNLVLTPELQASIQLLTLNRLELKQAIDDALLDNPLLEELLESDSYEERPIRKPDDEWPSIEQTLESPESLEQYLMWQVQMNVRNLLEKEIAEHLIGEMNEDGYLTPSSRIEELVLKVKSEKKATTKDRLRHLSKGESDAKLSNAQQDFPIPSACRDIADELDVPLEWVEKVRQQIIQLDPVGCLAQNAQECLCAQILALGFTKQSVEYTLIKSYLEILKRHEWSLLKKELNVSQYVLQKALRIIDQLEPIPSRRFQDILKPVESSYMIPDVQILRSNERFLVALNDDGLPKLRINKHYLNQAKTHPESKSFIQQKLRAATWMIRAIQQRQKTLFRVAEAIVKHQEGWFKGTSALVPLTLKAIADELELHESTISRVTTQKFLQTERGVFELKYFFTGALMTSTGESISNESVKEFLKSAIQHEDKRAPYSDAQLVLELHKRNIVIARRTVTKYREALGILPSHQRRLFI